MILISSFHRDANTEIGGTIDSASWTRLTWSCLEHGGAAYLVARVISIVLVGVPLLFFEISIGQLSAMGPFKFFGTTNLKSVFSGVGVLLIFSSVYKAIGDTALAMWPISNSLILILGEHTEGRKIVFIWNKIDNNILAWNWNLLLVFSAANTTLKTDVLQGFTQLDALTVVSLSITWVFGVLIVICGIQLITKVMSFRKMIVYKSA